MSSIHSACMAAPDDPPLMLSVDDIEMSVDEILKALAGRQGFFLLKLPEAARIELVGLRELAATFFAQPADVKVTVTGDGNVGGEGVGYRNSPEHETEFLKTFVHLRSGRVEPPIDVQPDELGPTAAAVHRRLQGGKPAVALRVLMLAAAACSLSLRRRERRHAGHLAQRFHGSGRGGLRHRG